MISIFRKISGVLFLLGFAAGCSSSFTKNEQERITLSGAQPDSQECQFVAQAVGTGGGDLLINYVGDLSLREGALDDIRHIAQLRKANLIHVQESQTNVLSDDGDATGTIIGQLYKCL